MRSILGLCAMTLTAAGLALLPVAAAQAQAPSAPSTTPSPKAKPADITDKKLDATAAAVKNVSAIKTSYDQKLAQAPASEKGRIVDDKELKDTLAGARPYDSALTADGLPMTKAVTDQGLSVDEYTAIIEVAQSDPAVRDKLLKRIK